MKGYTAKLFGAVAAGMLLTALAPMLAFAGWNSGDGYWYMYEPGKVYCDQFAQIDGYVYSFDENGYMETGWVQDENNFLGYGADAWCYADSSGALVNNQWVGDCYIEQGVAVTSDWLLTWLDNDYYFDENGHWVPNEWYQYPDGWCLWLGNQSWATNEMYMVDGEAYFFDENGYMITDTWRVYQYRQYYFGSSGALARSQWVDGTCYVDNKGLRLENATTPDGYRIVDGEWDGKGKSFVWRQSSNGKWWAETPEGSYLMLFTDLSGTRYYFDENGYMVTGWFQLGEDWYYANSSGRILNDEWLDGTYYFNDECVMQTNSWVRAAGESCYSWVDESGMYDIYATKWLRAFI